MNNNALTSFLDQLNEQQRAAVTYTDGPQLVIAGAGSGKTRVLTYKIAYLLINGFEPWRIMALTFTNKAAREMKERIAQVAGHEVAGRLWMGTFHSVFLRILRRHSDRLGFDPSFTIYDASDSKSLVKTIIKDLNLDEKVYKPATIAAMISNAKNALVSPEQYILDISNMKADERAGKPMFGKIFKIYCDRCRLAMAMDFDDILFFMNVLLRDNPDVLQHYREFFRYVLVDEYQDTNFAQHLIISQLTTDTGNLCVVGDDAQSIYSFRGANIRNILSLEKRFAGLRTFKLERNYRSTQNIINAAGSLIAKNSMQIRKNVYSENSVGDRINVIETFSELVEGYLVANNVMQSKLSCHDSYADYAVLYRTNAQSRVLEEALRKRNIPYRIYGGLAFYQRKEVKDALCYFRTAVNPHDDEAIKRIINFPARGIGATTLKKLQAAAIVRETSLWNVLINPREYGVNVNAGTIAKLNMFADLIREFNEKAPAMNAAELGHLIITRTGLLTMLMSDTTPESISKQENLMELLSALDSFVTEALNQGIDDVKMKDFLSEVSLATDADQEDDDEPKVTLMTVHAAKGLEFRHIYVVGVEEGLFPSSMCSDSIAEIEEERRLLYVAITRAKETCMITYARSRYRNGKTEEPSPSRFLIDIDPKYLCFKSSDNLGAPVETRKSFRNLWTSAQSVSAPSYRTSPLPTPKYQSTDTNYEDFTVHTASELSLQAEILHPKFGKGRIIKIERMDGAEVIQVNFEQLGEKKLMLKFARFKLL